MHKDNNKLNLENQEWFILENFLQDGSIGKYSPPPHMTTSKLQLSYKPMIIHNCHKLSWIEVPQLWN